ncbi:MAG: hypothetical protein K8H88_24620 [Sandaracinaceae bacterium]|nr:hypothetical protein [Sandaracinaceae bacterium]
MRRSIRSLLMLLVCGALATGCKVTTEDIDYWMGTVKGPGKIVAVLLADKYEDELRVHAGVALVRMEPRDDVDGLSELQAAIRTLPPESQTRIVDGMVPDLLRIMRGEDTPRSGSEEAVPPLQIRAKDAAFLLVNYASQAQRTTLTNAVVDWFVVDFNGRSLSGNYSAEQVVRQLGAPAASRLVNAMNARLPQQALVKLAELIATLGDDETKGRAAARMVEIEQEMEGAEFLTWLQERLREQFRTQQPNTPINEARIAAAAALNRENFINLGALPAMKHLNSQRVVADRLLAMGQASATEEPLLARRVKALQALEGGVRPDQLTPLLDLALAEATPIGVRDYAFDRISDARDASVIPRLWPVFTDTQDWRMRWRVGALILTLGGPAVVTEFFTRLNDESYAQEELHNYGERLSQMRPPPTDLVNTKLTSARWFDRCVALYFWEFRASSEADLGRITALAQDAAATAGENWRRQDTVGKVAEAVANLVRERLNQAQRQAQQGQAPAGAPQGGG